MSPRTIRQLPRHGLPDPEDTDLVHIVRMAEGRGFNGMDYYTYCNLRLSAAEKGAAPQHELVNCVRCLGTPKTCVKCYEPLHHPQLSSDVPERCEACAE